MAETKPPMQEIATIRRDINLQYFGNELKNQDDTLLTRGRGKGLKIYDEIERDCHAYAVLQKRKMAIVSREWTVEPASEAAIDVQAAELVRSAFEYLQFDRICMDLLDATLKGFAVGEVMWEVRDGKVLPADVIARDQRRFLFTPERELRLKTQEKLVEGEELPPRKFIVHRFGAKDGSPYGLGLGTRLFWPVLFKRQDITFWLTFADKFGAPTALGKYPNGTQPKEQGELLKALSAIAQDSGVVVPEGMVIELIEASRTGSSDLYERLARYLDEQISEAVLGETMTTSAAGAGLGSNQAGVHNDVREELAEADADLLSDTLNQTLVRWIVEFNLPAAGLPRVERDFSEPEDLKSRAERDKILFEMGYEPSEDYILETYGEGWVKKAPPEPMALPMFGGPPQPQGLNAPGDPDAEDPAFAEDGRPLQKASAQRAFNAARQQTLVDASEALAGRWQALMGKRVEELLSVLDETGDLVQFRERMAKLVDERPDEKTVEAIARATFASHVIGRGLASTPASKSITQKLRDLVRRRSAS